jgi:hypothetical protein
MSEMAIFRQLRKHALHCRINGDTLYAGTSPPMGAVKYAPHRKILGNLLDLVLDSRSHEQKVA